MVFDLMQVKVEGWSYSTFIPWLCWQMHWYGTFPLWLCWQMQCYETLKIDPLIGNNLRVNVAASSPCIGLYKLTCLQFRFSLPLACGLWALHCRTLVVLAGWFLFCGSLVCSPSSWCSCVGCVELLLCGLRCIAPSWAVLHCSFVGCIV